MRKFMRTRTRGLALGPHSPHLLNGDSSTHKSNGHAKTATAAGAADDHDLLSTLSSRYWSGSEEVRGTREGLWEDSEFPASWRTLGDKKYVAAAGLVWLRPHEVCARPTFLGEDSAETTAERWGDMTSAGAGGPLADTHLRVAAGALAHTPCLLARVAPPHSFTRNYNGSFRFRFWVFGSWRDVTVDDRLPVSASRLLAAHPAPHDDFTLPLLEKAYAKLYGSYAALRAGSVARALQDLTGGIVQSFALAQQPRSLTALVLHSALPRSTLLFATVTPEKGGAVRRLRNGLSSGCGYCVAGLARVQSESGPDGEVLLVRMRAGAAAAAGWSGAWSCSSAEWRTLPPADRDLLVGRAHATSHFWMSLAEVSVSFGTLVLVHVGPDDWMREPALRERRPWRAVLARRRWRRGYNAGGPPSNSIADTNPQFHLQILGADKCHALVALAQQYSVGGRGEERGELHGIGFAVYAVGAGGAPRRPGPGSLAGMRPLDVSQGERAREVVTLFALPPGEYLVVPHTRRPHTETSFLLRIFTDTQAHVWELNDDNVIIHDIGAESYPCGVRGRRAQQQQEEEGQEVDAVRLRRVAGAPALEVCRALVPLRDPAVRGAVRLGDVPLLVALAARWRAAFSAHASCGSVCSYKLRVLFRIAGVSVSNKVLECVVVRFARRARLSADAFLVAMARLHLAHERHRSLDAKLKSNPLSLEEMILMTVYS